MPIGSKQGVYRIAVSPLTQEEKVHLCTLVSPASSVLDLADSLDFQSACQCFIWILYSSRQLSAHLFLLKLHNVESQNASDWGQRGPLYGLAGFLPHQ